MDDQHFINITKLKKKKKKRVLYYFSYLADITELRLKEGFGGERRPKNGVKRG
jgi:hypothetical protein